MNHLAERERGRNKRGGGEEREKKKKKKKKKKELSPESNLGPLILRDSGRYAYNSEGVAAATLKGPGENTGCTCTLPTRASEQGNVIGMESVYI